MKSCWRRSAAAAIALGAALSLPDTPAEAEGKKPPAQFEKLRTRDGTEYLDCRVVRVEPDALILRHRKGIARISFFDLSREIREAYEFNPFAAIDHYQTETERQREIRWKTFWDKQRHEAEVAREAERKKLLKKAVAEWIPVEAKVVRTAGDGFLARCKQVTFEKTKKRSKLGFLVDGPPRRKLVDFSGGSVVLLLPAIGPGEKLPRPNSTWKGYVAPWPEQSPGEAEGKEPSTPVHRAVKRP